MSDRDHAVRELAALLEADLRTSGAVTRAEMAAALKASLLSVMSEPSAEIVEPTEAERRERRVTMRFYFPQLPGCP